ncbi:MAG: hypothetical protein MPL62_10360 [Alphaproteobacteria bacterium]|nr:hypothetical protein [Alphaproteobacteria bacterium]
MGARFWVMVILSIMAVAGTGGWALLAVIPYWFYYFRDEYRKLLVANAEPEDLDDPINGAILGEMTYDDQLQNEAYKRNVRDWV